jgi:hypothetical protein
MKKPRSAHADRGPAITTPCEESDGMSEITRQKSTNVNPAQPTRMPAGRAFPMGTAQIIDARYVGPRVETRIKKVMRSDAASVLILFVAILGGSALLFLVAWVAGVI